MTKKELEAIKLLEVAEELELKLSIKGNFIEVNPPNRCPPELLIEFVSHVKEISNLLKVSVKG